jgi:predicted glycogen debranching enzyme
MSLHLANTPLEDLLSREWLTVNHLGGYASGTPVGINTRKYHGLLVAAMAPPVRRMVLLSRVEESIHIGNRSHFLSASEYPQTIHPTGFEYLVAFDHDPFPRWAFQGEGWTLEKTLRLVPDRNAVCLSYTLLGGWAAGELQLRPMLALRGIHELMFQWNGPLEALALSPGHHRVEATVRTPEVYFAHDGAFGSQPLWYLNTIYRREQQRGYAGLEDVWSPGLVRWNLSPGRSVHFVCCTDPIDLPLMLADLQRYAAMGSAPGGSGAVHVAPSTKPPLDTSGSALERSALQFVPVDSADVGARRALLLTQYPWSPPLGRDAMIALPGLFLATRRFDEAKALLQSMASDLWNGLLPSSYPEDGSAPRYEGADVSLWFVHALGQYLRYTGEDPAAHGLLVEAVAKIIEAYQHGTTLGIGTDLDGLLFTHAAGVPTTWMDAKVGDWVITPRQGRPVEVNALWYNAVCIAADLMRSIGRVARAEELAMLAVSIRHAFNRRFWNEKSGCCFDVVMDYGVDDAIRPNQLLAFSLPHAVLSTDRHASVLKIAKDQLLTPVGLRTLAASEAAYAGRYEGDPVSRDRACHQGSVYPWLLGPYADALLRVNANSAAAREELRLALNACLDQLNGDGLGQLCELFDGDVPRRPGGAIADVRSVAEVFRVYVEGVLAIQPGATLESDLARSAPESIDLPS